MYEPVIVTLYDGKHEYNIISYFLELLEFKNKTLKIINYLRHSAQNSDSINKNYRMIDTFHVPSFLETDVLGCQFTSDLASLPIKTAPSSQNHQITQLTVALGQLVTFT